MKIQPLNIDSKKKYILVYTICFIVMAFAASLPWIVTGTSGIGVFRSDTAGIFCGSF